MPVVGGENKRLYVTLTTLHDLNILTSEGYTYQVGNCPQCVRSGVLGTQCLACDDTVQGICLGEHLIHPNFLFRYFHVPDGSLSVASFDFDRDPMTEDFEFWGRPMLQGTPRQYPDRDALRAVINVASEERFFERYFVETETGDSCLITDPNTIERVMKTFNDWWLHQKEVTHTVLDVVE